MRAAFKFTTKAIFVICLLVSAAAVPALPQDKSVSVPFKFEHGEIVLSVLVDGKPTNLILDTGAVDTAINSKCMSMFSDSETMARSADGKEVPLSIGKARISLAGREFDAQVLALQKSPRDADGMIGQNILSLFSSVTVDYKHSVVTFEK